MISKKKPKNQKPAQMNCLEKRKKRKKKKRKIFNWLEGISKKSIPIQLIQLMIPWEHVGKLVLYKAGIQKSKNTIDASTKKGRTSKAMAIMKCHLESSRMPESLQQNWHSQSHPKQSTCCKHTCLKVKKWRPALEIFGTIAEGVPEVTSTRGNRGKRVSNSEGHLIIVWRAYKIHQWP